MKTFNIDNQLNRITMYQLLVFGLSGVLGAAVVLSFVHILPLSWVAISASSLVILTAVFIADRAATIAWNAPSNLYSSLITGLILSCILPPSTHVHQLLLAALLSMLAVASKYILAHRHKQIFNPAAVGAAIGSISGLLPATWWIGSPQLLPLTLVFGFLVVRKIRRLQLFWSFLLAAVAVGAAVGLSNHQPLFSAISSLFTSSPLIFLGSVMLTEPTTMPPRQWQRYIYGAFVGGLFASQLRIGIAMTPELALLIGNVYSYAVSPKHKLRARFLRKQQLSPGFYEFQFAGAKTFAFRPGQYLEWTLPQNHSDSRGNRRTFSISSAPGEDILSFAVRIPEKTSTFKRDLQTLTTGDSIVAGQLSGDFLLPTDLSVPLCLLAGGIGVTPFVSMARNMIARQEKRDIVLFYFVLHETEVCFADVWKHAKPLGLKLVPVVAEPDAMWRGETGRLSSDMLTRTVPGYAARRYYISGPPGLVTNYRQLLLTSNIPRQQIHTDFFAGY